MKFIFIMMFFVSCKTTSVRKIVYKIKITSGDTIAAIAQKYDTTPRSIYRLNGITSADELAIGSTIYLKPGANGIVAKNKKEIEISQRKSNKGFLFGRRSTSIIWPVKGVVTSEYGRRWGKKHTGIDISAKSGTPIYSAAAGVVEAAQWKKGYGRTVIIRHNGFKTLYAHCSKLIVKKGQKIRQGMKIALVGQTGNSSGPHLHFEYQNDKGIAKNPRLILKSSNKFARN